jgi:ABC-type branched-subunit amino acid transport system ATPase component
MGGGGSKLGPKEVLIIGLDNAGKTTFFQQLQNHFKLSATEVRNNKKLILEPPSLRSLSLSSVTL